MTADIRTVPVTLLRAGAALLGAYGYVLGLWLARHGLNPEPVATVREWVNRPLGLGEDFGPLAVMLLLAATGYAIGGRRPVRLVLTAVPALVATACVCFFVYHDMARLLEFLPLVLIGLVTRWTLGGTLPTWAGVLLGAACFGAVIAADDALPGLRRWWYPVAATFAALLFLVAVRPGPTATAVAAHPVTRGLALVAEVPLLVGSALALVVVP
ncbi:hypothetical protein [Actinophytocola sp.]|uniref:hypothetical protein n=1 Tax=Actinophytocola sp. TaxID=1872138 RepID=UPI003899FAED